MNDWSTLTAALWLLSPACEALMVTAPAPVIVTVLPLIEAGPDKMLKLTTNPDEAEALTVNGGSPKVLSARGPKVID